MTLNSGYQNHYNIWKAYIYVFQKEGNKDISVSLKGQIHGPSYFMPLFLRNEYDQWAIYSYWAIVTYGGIQPDRYYFLLSMFPRVLQSSKCLWHLEVPNYKLAALWCIVMGSKSVHVLNAGKNPTIGVIPNDFANVTVRTTVSRLNTKPRCPNF